MHQLPKENTPRPDMFRPRFMWLPPSKMQVREVRRRGIENTNRYIILLAAGAYEHYFQTRCHTAERKNIARLRLLFLTIAKKDRHGRGDDRSVDIGLGKGQSGRPCRLVNKTTYLETSWSHNDISSGGAQGIGAATVSQLYQSGAHVFFGDWDETKGSKLAEDLQASQRSDGGVTYLKVNIREYQSLLSLFDTAYDKHGQIDMAICCAAVTERPGYWEPEKLTLQSVREVCETRWQNCLA
jgi:hypothetical protein